jgi:DNA-directed RNA polymerase specialized sigma24 family protein
VARVLGCSTEAVHVRRYRAVKRLGYAMARAGHMRGESAPRTRVEGGSHVD